MIKNIYTILKFTFLEVYRSRIMLGLVAIALILFLATYVASEFAYGAPDKVALDFGIGLMSISNLIVAIFLGVTLISKEVEQKTLYMVLSRPVSRSSFLVGKVFGLSCFLMINTFVTGLICSIMYYLLGGTVNALVFWTCLFSFLESLLILLFAVLYSLISNTSLAAMFTIFTFVASHTLTNAAKNFFLKTNLYFSRIVDIASVVVPDLERINTKDFLIYKQELSANFLISSLTYVLCYILALFLLNIIVFNNKNLD